MSKLEKELKRLKSKPKNFTYDEAKSLLNKLEIYEENKGKTSGSRVAFVNNEKIKIELHKPHSGNVLKLYQINILIKKLKEMGVM